MRVASLRQRGGRRLALAIEPPLALGERGAGVGERGAGVSECGAGVGECGVGVGECRVGVGECALERLELGRRRLALRGQPPLTLGERCAAVGELALERRDARIGCLGGGGCLGRSGGCLGRGLGCALLDGVHTLGERMACGHALLDLLAQRLGLLCGPAQPRLRLTSTPHLLLQRRPHRRKLCDVAPCEGVEDGATVAGSQGVIGAGKHVRRHA